VDIKKITKISFDPTFIIGQRYFKTLNILYNDENNIPKKIAINPVHYNHKDIDEVIKLIISLNPNVIVEKGLK
jgi:hypothetical protein